MIKFCFIFFISILISNSLYSQKIGNETGLKLPRFASLKSNDSNLRIGSSINYPIKMKYIVTNMPIEILDEYKNWRKINDFEGNNGWLHKSLLKGNRYGIINAPYNEKVQIYKKPKGKVIGKIGNKNIVKINKCLLKWCHITIKKNNGWINKVNLWGVYEKEVFKVPFYQPLINIFWKITDR